VETDDLNLFFPSAAMIITKLARDQKLDLKQLLNEEEEEEEHGLSRAFFPYLVSLSTSLISMLNKQTKSI
jgi:hypothetical protein